MKTTNEITRRRFIKHMTILASSVTGLIHNPAFAHQSQKSDLHSIALNIVNALFQNSKVVSQLGAVYLRMNTDEKNLAHLLRKIFDENPTLLNIASKSNNKSTLMIALRKIITADFENGNILNMDGWVVAKTEARIFALTKLV